MFSNTNFLWQIVRDNSFEETIFLFSYESINGISIDISGFTLEH